MIRVLITWGVVASARRRNRDTVAWGIFGFLFTWITWLILVFLKPLHQSNREAVR